jgi:hypothetical protein
VKEGLLPPDPKLSRFYEIVNLERGIVIGLAALFAGLLLLGSVLATWRSNGYGELEYASTLRVAIPGATLVAIGFQTVLSGFFVSILGLRKR